MTFLSGETIILLQVAVAIAMKVPSTEIKRVAVKKLLEFNLMYSYVVGNGESKSFLDIWDVYGVCDHCIKVLRIINKISSKEYDDWIKTEDYQKYTASHDENN